VVPPKPHSANTNGTRSRGKEPRVTPRSTASKSTPRKRARKAKPGNDAGRVDTAACLFTFRQMMRIRVFEEHANELYLTAKMPGLTHMYAGEEAVAVGVCDALEKDDFITSTHRGHGHCIAKGARLDLMFAELLGKAAGYNRGKGGSMHIADQENGNLGANAIVGGSAGIATGAALSSKMRGSGQVVVCFFGEGALGQGLLYEVMNMAQLWKLPVIYVCENNLYNEYTHFQETTAGDILARPHAFGIHTAEVDGQDVNAVTAAASELITRARSGDGPAFLLAHTYRYYGHHVGDIKRDYYRSQDEESHWKAERDPLIIYRRWLLDQEIATADTLDTVEAEVRKEAGEAVEFGLQAPYPDSSEVSLHVYA
jgi:acetoin:2,6-dichlorophenolindophenol oxidoreductase subunit alpha